MKFYEKLIILRKKALLSQEALAEKLDVTRQTISKWELDQTKPDMDKLKEISKLFDVDINVLTDDTISLEDNKNMKKQGRNIYMKENRKLLKDVLDDIRQDMSDEEVLNLLANRKISVRPESEGKYTLGQRAADAIARFAGSWAFIFSFTGVLVLWMVVNILRSFSS